MIIKSMANCVDVITTTIKEGNIALHTGELKEKVVARRIRLMKQLGASIDALTCPQVAHDKHFYEVKIKDIGRGSQSDDDAIFGVDALYTREPNVYLMMFHADCVPIAIYAPDQQIIAIIHSGWPGTSKQIITHLVTHLKNEEQCDPEKMIAWIGPAISKENYEVSKEVAQMFNTLPIDLKDSISETDDDHYLIDLAKICLLQLKEAGVKKVEKSDRCTYSDHTFYSFRRDHTYERNATLIVRKQ